MSEEQKLSDSQIATAILRSLVGLRFEDAVSILSSSLAGALAFMAHANELTLKERRELRESVAAVIKDRSERSLAAMQAANTEDQVNP